MTTDDQLTDDDRLTRARRSENALRAIVQSSPLPIVALDSRGTVGVWNRASEELFGWPAAEAIGGPPPFIDSVDELEALTVRAFSGETIQSEPARYLRRDGDSLEVNVSVAPLRNISGRIVSSVLVVADMTDQRRTELALRATESSVRASEERMRAIVDDQTELVCRYLPDATLTFANRAFAEFFGFTSAELVGRSVAELRPPSERSRTFDWSNVVSGESVRTRVEREASIDGTVRWYEWTDRAFADEAGDIVEFQSVGHDVTDQRRAAAFAVRQAEILEQVARGIPLDETLLTIARSFEEQFPRLACAITLGDGTTTRVGKTSGLPEAWSVPILTSDATAGLGTLDVFGPEPGPPDDDRRRLFALHARLASIAIERKTLEEQLAHRSMHDPLTGLPNRLLFLDRLGQSIARCVRTGTSVGVAFLDLDRFKNVNDSLGHDAGDELLVAVARKIESMIRPGDTVARFGGDEFAVLCEDLPAETAREQAVEIAERLLATVIRPLVVRGTEMFVGASVGIALSTAGEERPEEVLRDADAAMNHAKEAGRGRVEIFDDTMRTRALAAHSTENALHRALERGEFRLFFQPIINLSDARCVGVEALVRWQHPERGLLHPVEFVPLAEETGLVVQIGLWVLEEAARNAARWQLEQPEPFLVAVNLSARQLAQPDLAERVAEIIAATGVRPSSLCFEITESVLMDDAESVLDAITRVRALGVQFAIDDFGTGYSSLGYLKRFPVDSVKIDRSFVTGLGSDPGDAAIVSAVIGLAHALGLRVTAEGVETEEQLTALVALDCDEAQGYFFSPPQPAPDLRRLIARTRTWRPPGAGVMRPAGGLRPRPAAET